MRSLAKDLLAWYERHGRRHLPWRQTRDPFKIVVSEFMLQQTQVDRVLPLYNAFIAAFPAFATLAAAPVADVVRAWRGLGYNSRAIRLQQLARTVTGEYHGRLPHDRDALLALPGIGPYTAAAVRAFAFNENDAAVDTNIRRIVHRVTFGLEHPPLATQEMLDEQARASVPDGRGHDWNSAMMDLGSIVCTARAPKCLICPLRSGCAAAPIDAAHLAQRAAAHRKKSPQEALPFERTTRFLRGRIIDRLRDLPPARAVSLLELERDLSSIIPRDRLADIPAVVADLIRDGLVSGNEHGIALSML
ncbi:MAG: A/G-specific adenine glycosylase [Candidatus Velthaea sp.]